MKKFREWKSDKKYYQNILPRITEWSVQNPLGGRGMSSQESQEMDRIGQILGYNKKWWNVLSKDSRHGGDETMTKLQQIRGMTGTMQQKMDALGQLINDPTKIAQNAPFKVAYDMLSRIKNRVNKIDRGNLNHEDTELLMTVLANAYKGGDIPFDKLNRLWRHVTGIMDDKGNVIDDATKNQILQNDVHTPAHLLKVLFGIGGGVFSSPSNISEIKGESVRLMHKLYPDEFHDLMNLKQQVQTGNFTPPQQQQQSQTQGIPPQVLNDLQTVLNLKNSPGSMASALDQLIKKYKNSP